MNVRENSMKHRTITRVLDKTRTMTIVISSVGSQPTQVVADYTIRDVKTQRVLDRGMAYGGFQRREDFDFDIAAALAISNAVARGKHE